MADIQTQLEIAPLGTRERVIEVAAEVPVTDTADTTHTVAVVFDRAYVRAPKVVGVNAPLAASAKGSPSCTDITTTGCNVNLYQALVGALATQDHTVSVNLVGWQV